MSLFASRYELIKEIGSGATANVYEAFDQINKINVAIKLFKNEVQENDSNYKKFINECMIVTSLNNINIVSTLNSGVNEGHPFIVNELIKGSTLKDLLDSRGYLTIQESYDVMVQLLSALNYAHIHQCVHKDIKPQNIYIQNDGTVKLGDFGISEILSLNSKGERKVMGTVQYCAPEIFEGSNASVASDIYASGIVFYEMLTGKLPFNGSSIREIALGHMKSKFPSLNNSLKSYPKKLDKIILKSTMKNPKKRYKNCDEFLQEINKLKEEIK